MGTMGFEAIRGGKACIYFGWGTLYKRLTGAFEFSQELNIEEISNVKIDHTKFIKEVNDLKSSACNGVLYYHPDDRKDFDIQNNKTICNSFQEIMEEIA